MSKGKKRYYVDSPILGLLSFLSPYLAILAYEVIARYYSIEQFAFRLLLGLMFICLEMVCFANLVRIKHKGNRKNTFYIVQVAVTIVNMLFVLILLIICWKAYSI